MTRWPMLLVLGLLAACASVREPRPTAPSGAGDRVRVSVGDHTYVAELYDHPTARDLLAQLPLTVIMEDLHGLEKFGPLPRALPTEGVPSGADPEPNELGYYAPGRALVLYNGDVGYFPGIVRLGRFTDDLGPIAELSDGMRVTVERA